MTRALLLDSHPVFLSGLAALVERELGYSVVGTATSRDDALAAVDAHRPTLVLLDLFLGTDDGLELVRSLTVSDASVRVLVVSGHDELVYAGRAIKAGAHGYVSKSASEGEILDAVRTVAEGQVSLSPRVRERLVGRYLGHDEAPSSPVSMLTDRELEAFRLFGMGLATAAVAESMSVSAKTVETYRLSIKSKLGLQSNNEFIYRAVLWSLGRSAPAAV